MDKSQQLKEFIKNPMHTGLQPEKGEIDKSLQNKNLSESQRRMQEIAKECGLKRFI